MINAKSTKAGNYLSGLMAINCPKKILYNGI
jgi:hypothetical protein